MAKSKKKKDKKLASSSQTSQGKSGKSSKSAKVTRRLKAISDNPMVADIVAAALVATASALKDSKKARQLASQAGDELIGLSKEGAERGNALWDLALEVGRRSLEALSGEEAPKRSKSKASSRPTKKAKK